MFRTGSDTSSRRNFRWNPEAAQKTLNKPGALDRLVRLRDKYAGTEDWSATNLEAVLKQLGTELGCKIGELVHPARVAVSGRSIGPSPLSYVGGHGQTAGFCDEWTGHYRKLPRDEFTNTPDAG